METATAAATAGMKAFHHNTPCRGTITSSGGSTGCSTRSVLVMVAAPVVLVVVVVIKVVVW